MNLIIALFLLGPMSYGNEYMDAERDIHLVPMRTHTGSLADYLNLWQVWDPEEREAARKLAEPERLKMINRHYGFYESPLSKADNPDGMPLGLISSEIEDASGAKVKVVTTNCFMCHASRIEGKLVWGAKNPMLDIQSVAEDFTRLQDLKTGRPLSTAFKFTTFNMFAGGFNTIQQLGERFQWRDESSLDRLFSWDEVKNGSKKLRSMGNLIFSETVVLPWWNTKYKQTLFWDGWLTSDNDRHSAAFRMAISPIGTTSAETIKKELYRLERMHRYTVAQEAPKYPYPIDEERAARGRTLFRNTCAKCHGYYDGPTIDYPENFVDNGKMGMDPTRLNAMTKEYLDFYRGWISNGGKYPVKTKTEQMEGYLSPPLKGIWALAPYFHNGSVPTLFNVIKPETRPAIWKMRNADTYDWKNVGLAVDRFDRVPGDTSNWRRRQYIDTSSTTYGKSSQGHDKRIFKREFSNEEAYDIVEYLKTL